MTKNPLGCFSVLKDPRINRTKLYNLEAIIFQTVSAIISGCDSWTEIELFGETKKEWLEDYVHIPNGTPSHDTLSDLFDLLGFNTPRLASLLHERCSINVQK